MLLIFSPNVMQPHYQAKVGAALLDILLKVATIEAPPVVNTVPSTVDPTLAVGAPTIGLRDAAVGPSSLTLSPHEFDMDRIHDLGVPSVSDASARKDTVASSTPVTSSTPVASSSATSAAPARSVTTGVILDADRLEVRPAFRHENVHHYQKGPRRTGHIIGDRAVLQLLQEVCSMTACCLLVSAYLIVHVRSTIPWWRR